MTKKGKDGSYVSKPDSRGVYKWIRLRVGSGSAAAGLGRKDQKGRNVTRKVKGTKSYMIHDNGNTPWKVEVNGSSVSIYKGDLNDNGEYNNYDKLVKTINVKEVYPGEEEGLDKGNTVLLHIRGQKYIYVGGEIYEFTMDGDGDVISYYSKIGSNDVPYPVLVGSKNVYFLLERSYVSRDLFPATMTEVEWADAYWYYYGHRTFASGGKIRKSDHRNMKGIKVLQKRQ